MMAPSSKINLDDKVDDGEMDLSMCELQEVPVKEIASYRKVYSLDISNNHLVQLPKTFPTLTNLTKIDMSRNKLKKLPDNFGDLHRLKHLDLYKNHLEHLPLSFGQLKNLKWLDLKDNPLVPAIKEAAGDCLSMQACQVCAVNMVYFFVKLKERVDEDRELQEKQKQPKQKEVKPIASKPQMGETKSKKQVQRQKKKAESDDSASTTSVIETLPIIDNKPKRKFKEKSKQSPYSGIFYSLGFLSIILFTVIFLMWRRLDQILLPSFIGDTVKMLLRKLNEMINEILAPDAIDNSPNSDGYLNYFSNKFRNLYNRFV